MLYYLDYIIILVYLMMVNWYCVELKYLLKRHVKIQNYGVISFTHQKEFVLDKESSFYIPELASLNKIEISFKKIMNIIEKVSKMNIKTELIAKKNQIINSCENSLIDLCNGLF